MAVYRIRHWSKHFENHKSRVRERCSYVCMPNKQDGLGLGRILAERDGAAIFGVWCLILQACSRHTKREGWLTDDGTENGRPWDLDDLAFRWRRDPAEIRRCLDVVCDHKIGWMDRLSEKCPSDGAERPPSALKEGKEEKGREGSEPAPAARVVVPVEDQDEILDGDPNPERPANADPRRIADDLRSYVDWGSKDAERERGNVVELAQLVARYSLAPVQHAADVLSRRHARKAKVWELLPEIVAALAGPTTSPESARADKAAALVRQHGWKACAAAAGIPEAAIGRESTMVEAMVAQGDVFDAVAEKLGGLA